MVFLGEESPIADETHGLCHANDLFPAGDSFFHDLGFSGDQTKQPERFIAFLVYQIAFPVHFANGGLANDTFTAFVKIGKKRVGTVNANVAIFFM